MLLKNRQKIHLQRDAANKAARIIANHPRIAADVKLDLYLLLGVNPARMAEPAVSADEQVPLGLAKDPARDNPARQGGPPVVHPE